MRSPLSLLVVLAAVGAACTGAGDGATTTTPATTATTPVSTAAPTSSPATTGAPTTASTLPATTAPATTAPATTSPPTTAPCDRSDFDIIDRVDGYPERMTAMVGDDIRTGAHPCYERIVIEFETGSAPIPGGMPGWAVRYADGPVYLGESGETVDIEGAATLLVSVAAWMPNMEGEGYAGPTQIFPTNVSHLLELRQVDNWEGQHTWAIGLDRERPFHVFTLTRPVRLVIDVQV